MPGVEQSIQTITKPKTAVADGCDCSAEAPGLDFGSDAEFAWTWNVAKKFPPNLRVDRSDFAAFSRDAASIAIVKRY